MVNTALLPTLLIKAQDTEDLTLLSQTSPLATNRGVRQIQLTQKDLYKSLKGDHSQAMSRLFWIELVPFMQRTLHFSLILIDI